MISGPLEPGKPFMPFGPQPKLGASFIIGSQEVFQKTISQLSLNITWDKLPTEIDFEEYYDKYFQSLNGNSDFRCRISLLEPEGWSDPPLLDTRLFGGANDTAPDTSNYSYISRTSSA